MKRIGSYALLAACVFITYESYQNSRQEEATERFAMQVACDIDSSCIVTQDRASQTRTDPFRRRYEFKTSSGPVLVTCKRAMVWLGDWKCSSEKGGFLSY